MVARLDPRRLDVIVANLVGNAFRHGAEPVSVRLSADPDWVTIEVADQGPGLDPEVLPHVFDRLYKADTARTRSEGSGLGLAISWENARLHRHGERRGSLVAGNGARRRRGLHAPAAPRNDGRRRCPVTGRRTGRALLAGGLLLGTLLAAGCGVRPSPVITGRSAVSGPAQGIWLYLVAQGELVLVLRPVNHGPADPPSEALARLAAGPQQNERAQGLTSEVPTGFDRGHRGDAGDRSDPVTSRCE